MRHLGMGPVTLPPCLVIVFIGIGKYPEGQRFKSFPRNQRLDNNKIVRDSSCLVYKSLDFTVNL